MPGKKPFNTTSFKNFSDAVYTLHNLLVAAKKILKEQDFQEAKKGVARSCADGIEVALEKAGINGTEWLAEIRENPEIS